MHSKTIYNDKSSLTLSGINGQNTKTFGTIIGSLITTNGNLKHTFHLVDSNVNLNYDGLLGGDFLSQYRASISYDTFELKLNSPVNSISEHVSTTAGIGVVITDLSHSNHSASIGIQTDFPNSNRLACTDNQTDLSSSASFGNHTLSASIGIHPSSASFGNHIQSASIGIHPSSASIGNQSERSDVIDRASLTNLQSKQSVSFDNSESNQSIKSGSVNLLTQTEHEHELSSLFSIQPKLCQKITVAPEDQYIYLPARSESVIEISHCIKGEYLCHQEEVVPGIFVGNSIGVVRNGMAIINIINVTEKTVQIPKADVDPLLEPLSEHDILQLDYNQDPVEERIAKINQLINLDHCNVEEKGSINKLFRQYNQLFYLKGDHLTFTDAIQHNIPIKENHLSPLGGHQGITRTLKRIKLSYYWKGMVKDITNVITKCQTCQLNKVSRINKVPMKITTTSSRVFERVFVDIVGPLTVSYHHNKYILTFQDDLTKYSEAIPIPNQEARTVAEALVTRIICIHGMPEAILTDKGSNFLSDCFKEVCKLLKVSKLQTTPYHPQTNGALERSHRGLSEYLRNFVQKDPLEWCQWLPYAMFVYNTTPHSTTNFTPHELVYGFPARIPTALSTKPNLSYNYENYVSELKARLQHSHLIARKNIVSSKKKSKKQYDKKTKDIVFNIGDLVLLRNEARKNKLSQIWTGPWEVTFKNSRVNTTIKNKRRSQTVHNNRIKHYRYSKQT